MIVAEEVQRPPPCFTYGLAVLSHDEVTTLVHLFFLEPTVIDEYDLVAFSTFAGEYVLQRAEEPEVNDLVTDLFSEFSSNRLLRSLARFDATPEWPVERRPFH